LKNIVIIDYHLGNLFSVIQAFRHLGIEPIVSSSREDIQNAHGLVLPGVGSFDQAMKNIKELGIDKIIVEKVRNGCPLFGICLGLQLLFEVSEEGEQCDGLGILSGKVIKLDNLKSNNSRIPHMNWAKIKTKELTKSNNSPININQQDKYFYFVHSYYVEPEDQNIILTQTKYGNGLFTSSVLIDNVFACQFHPEKSSEEGLEIFNNWLNINKLI